jgi:hypothetical protein
LIFPEISYEKVDKHEGHERHHRDHGSDDNQARTLLEVIWACRSGHSKVGIG